MNLRSSCPCLTLLVPTTSRPFSRHLLPSLIATEHNFRSFSGSGPLLSSLVAHCLSSKVCLYCLQSLWILLFSPAPSCSILLHPAPSCSLLLHPSSQPSPFLYTWLPSLPIWRMPTPSTPALGSLFCGIRGKPNPKSSEPYWPFYTDMACGMLAHGGQRQVIHLYIPST